MPRSEGPSSKRSPESFVFQRAELYLSYQKTTNHKIPVAKGDNLVPNCRLVNAIRDHLVQKQFRYVQTREHYRNNNYGLKRTVKMVSLPQQQS